MKIIKRNICWSVCIVLLFLEVSHKTYSQELTKDSIISKVDTIHFSPNKVDGWQLYTSYIEDKIDSTSLFILIQHNRNNIDWNIYQFIGQVKDSSLYPHTDQEIIYSLLNSLYNVRISTEGKCYISLNKGAIPDGDPVIIPVQVCYYKK